MAGLRSRSPWSTAASGSLIRTWPPTSGPTRARPVVAKTATASMTTATVTSTTGAAGTGSGTTTSRPTPTVTGRTWRERSELAATTATGSPASTGAPSWWRCGASTPRASAPAPISRPRSATRETWGSTWSTRASAGRDTRPRSWKPSALPPTRSSWSRRATKAPTTTSLRSIRAATPRPTSSASPPATRTTTSPASRTTEPPRST